MLLGRVTDQKKFDILRGAKGFIQASKEDFGISSVEAQACGIPVIAFGEGGALETVIGTQSNDNPTGVFFYKQSEDELIKKIIEFSKLEFNKADCVKNAKKFSGKNFRYIQTKTEFRQKEISDFYKSKLYYVLIILSLLSIPAGILISRNKRKRNKDIVGRKQRKAERLTKKYLSKAQKQLGKKEAFYEALEKALHNYLKAKLKVETSDISKDKITEVLINKNIDKSTVDSFINVLKASDFARYTPVTDTQMKLEFERAKRAIVQLDKEL